MLVVTSASVVVAIGSISSSVDGGPSQPHTNNQRATTSRRLERMAAQLRTKIEGLQPSIQLLNQVASSGAARPLPLAQKSDNSRGIGTTASS